MAQAIEIKKGRKGFRGFIDTLWATVTGGVLMQSIHAPHTEMAMNGNLYTIQVKSATVTAVTDISPLPATTGRALLGVFNPISSGVNIVLVRCGMSTISGTPGGPFYLDVLSAAGCDQTGTTDPVNNSTLNTTGAAGRYYAAGVPKNTNIMTMNRPIGGQGAIALGAGINSFDHFFDGSVIIPPGGLAVISAHAVGTTHVVSGYLECEEIPIL